MKWFVQTESESRADRLRWRRRKESVGDERAEATGRPRSRHDHQGRLEGAITGNTNTDTTNTTRQVDHLTHAPDMIYISLQVQNSRLRIIKPPRGDRSSRRRGEVRDRIIIRYFVL